jgi:c-di-GMP-binding flagellar brake protein YcgR
MIDRRRYLRYKIRLKGKAATSSGHSFPVEILDISIEGAKFKTDRDFPIRKKENIYLVIKWNYPIKAKSEIKWVKKENFNTYFGVQFVKMSNEDKEIFISNIADYASSNISDIYFR